MDTPVRWPPLNVITPFHIDSSGLVLATTITVANCASAAIGTNNLILYWPFVIAEPATAVRLSLMNGGTASGNIDLGIYDGGKNRVVNTGTTTQTGTNVVQDVDITDTLLLPGRYFMAVQFSSSTATLFRTAQTDETLLSTIPVYIEAAGGFGLPSSATMTVDTAASPVVPLMGVHFSTVI